MQSSERISKMSQIIYNGENKPENYSDEENLAYYILKKRYENLIEFCKKSIKDKYSMSDEDVEKLVKNWFLYNSLEEINFIGTDLYANAMFVKHEVPFLYRSVGKDNTSIVWDSSKDYDGNNDIVKIIFGACLEQIKSGGNGTLFSYTKCFGRMLYKYTNFRQYNESHTIEIRKQARINTISRGGEQDCSLQDFVSEDIESTEKKNYGYLRFSVDMSNARANSVTNLKEWIDRYIGRQEYISRFNDIFYPIGDAEVVCNFTNKDYENLGFRNIQCDEVERFEYGAFEFCLLLYKYSVELSEKLEKKEAFNCFVQASINTINNTRMKEVYDKVLQSSQKVEKIDKILSFIDWELEKKYMQRQKSEKDNGEKIPIDVYKEGNQEQITGVWKQICIEAVKGNYSYVDCSNL